MKAVFLAILFCVGIDVVCTHGVYTAYAWHGIAELVHNTADATRNSIFNR